MACVRFSEQKREDDGNSVSFRWRLVEDFVDEFNENRARKVTSSELICVDESVEVWWVGYF